ncbi:MAG: hypothetical protein AAFW65_08275 [Pseudomonadota bacterium]
MADSERDPFSSPDPAPVGGGQPIAAVGQGMRTLVRQLFALLGLVLIIVGVPIAILTPFPFVPIGLPIVILGVALLGRNSLWGRNWMEGVLSRHPNIERFAPNWLMKLVFGREKKRRPGRV